MRIESHQSRAIFEQLREESQPGVKCVIENHDAWVNSADVVAGVNAAVRERVGREPRMAVVAERIAAQRERLQALVTRLPGVVRAVG